MTNNVKMEDNQENTQTTNINKEELDEEIVEKLKGDAIGDTLYSQSFVLKTLLQLSDLKWNEETEENLCFLWDMTVETEVCEYLFRLNYPSLACSAIIKYENNRFIEIIVGILANILCSNCQKNISDEEIGIVLNVLETDDSLVLIQVCRFISAISYINKNLSFISESVISKLNFILSNSINKELILKTFEAVSKLTVDFKVDKSVVNCDIIKSALIGFDTIFNDGQFEIETQEDRLVTKFLLEIFTNVCAYADRDRDKNLLKQLGDFSNNFVNNCLKILNFYSTVENLFPITDEFSFYISAILYIVKLLNVGFINDFFMLIHKILCLLLDVRDECSDIFKTLLELEGYQISTTQGEIIYKTIKKCNKKNLCNILECFKKNSEDFEDFDITDQLEYLENRFRHK